MPACLRSTGSALGMLLSARRGAVHHTKAAYYHQSPQVWQRAGGSASNECERQRPMTAGTSRGAARQTPSYQPVQGVLLGQGINVWRQAVTGSEWWRTTWCPAAHAAGGAVQHGTHGTDCCLQGQRCQGCFYSDCDFILSCLSLLLIVPSSEFLTSAVVSASPCQLQPLHAAYCAKVAVRACPWCLNITTCRHETLRSGLR